MPHSPEEFQEALVIRLVSPVDKIVKKSELGVKIPVMRKKDSIKGKHFQGWLIIQLMYHLALKQYKFSANSTSYYDMKRIQALRCNGDKDLVRFLADWDTTAEDGGATIRLHVEQVVLGASNVEVRHCREFGYLFDQSENAD
eukprot:449418-Amphidinium_carterae.1